jgi:thiamine biosynthesis lipoprotein
MDQKQNIAKSYRPLLCFIATALLACALSLASCASANADAEKAAGGGAPTDGATADGAPAEAATEEEASSSYDDVNFVMGTVVTQTIYSENKDIAAEIIALLTKIEQERISWRVESSDIAAVNDKAGSGAPTEVANETAGYIASAVKIATDSGGAFDPTTGKLSRLWDFDSGKKEIPNEDEIAKLVEDVGYPNVEMTGNSVLLKTEAALDLGAIGKGIGCDETERYLSGREDVRGALVNIGGSSVLTYGEKDSGEPWKVAVLNPRDENDFLGAISLTGTNHVSTSADYERYFEVDGKRYHHLLDPATGYPADGGLMSVTVVTTGGAESDALSTACFVLGREKSLSLLKKYGADAIFVDTDKKVYLTDGLKDKFELMASGYKVV